MVLGWYFENCEDGLGKFIKDIPIEFDPSSIELMAGRGPMLDSGKHEIKIYPKEGKITEIRHIGKSPGFNPVRSDRCYFHFKGRKYVIFYKPLK